jgi:tetratricopeptide (TPR) repeat protein
MHLANELLRELDTPGLSLNERGRLRCRLARQLEQAGDFEAAREALGELWQGEGARPLLEGLDDETKAEVLLRVGALTGWIGRATQIEGSQEMAKDLIGESARVFERLGKRNRIGEARSELALCYWRAGAFDEARVILQEALDEFDESDLEQRAIALLRKAIVERSSTRLGDALSVYNEAAPLFAHMDDHLLAAHFHHGFANVLNQLGAAEQRQDYIDRALIEYSAASFHFEQAGQIRVQACVDINIGFLFFTLGKLSEAHKHLNRAQVLLTKLKDNLHLARVDETRARVLLAEGSVVEAEKAARSAVHVLEKGDELSWLAETLTTHGITLARLNHSDQARAVLERAVNIAEQAGDFESAGVSALTIIEVFGASLTKEEIWATMDRAGVLLERTQDTAILRRLATAFRSLFLTHSLPTPSDWKGFSFKRAVERYEGHLIKLALQETGGKVTAASRLLGFNHHQSLIALIASRHKDLLETGARAPVRPRRHHLMPHAKRKPKQSN